VFSRLQRRQAQFFQEASAGLLALVRLAAHDDGDDDGEEDEESVQAIDGRNIVPLEQVRAAIVDDIVQVALTVREACIAVDVRFSFNASRSWQEGIVSCCLYLIAVQAFQVHLAVSSCELCTVRVLRFLPINCQCLTYAQDVGELQVDEHREDFQQRLGMFALQILVCTLSHF
jgi:hypothetical protein